MNPFETGTAHKNASFFVGGLMFFLTLSALNSVGTLFSYIAAIVRKWTLFFAKL
jgi:hypothetical protein